MIQLNLLTNDGHTERRLRAANCRRRGWKTSALLRIVIIGARSEVEEAEKIRDALAANARLQHVQLVQAHISSTGYSLMLRQGSENFDLSRFEAEFVGARNERRKKGDTWHAEVMRRRAAKGAADRNNAAKLAPNQSPPNKGT